MPTGRFEAGAVLDEIDRLGGWVRVRAPDGERWWVDGRRLEGADVPATEDSAPPGPTKRRRLPVLVLCTALLGLAALVAGVVVLVTRDDPPEPPTTLTNVVTVDVAPELLASTWWGSRGVWFSDGDTAARLEVPVRLGYFGVDESDEYTDQLDLDRLYLGEVSGAGNAVTAGVVALDSFTDTLVVAYDDGTVVRWDRLYGRRGHVRLPVEDEQSCCAGAIAMGSERASLFPVGPDGRSDTMWIVDFESGSVTSVVLPIAGIVRDAYWDGGTVFVALDTGLVAIGLEPGIDWDRTCQVLLGQWEVSASALFPTRTPDGLDRLLALDPETATITVFEPWGYAIADGGCRAGSSPSALGTVDLASAVGRPLSLGASLVSVDEVAYVLTTGGELLMVDVSEPTVVRDDRHVGTVPGLDTSGRTSNRLAAFRDIYDWPAFVVVANSDASGFWVIGEGDEGTPVETIDLRRGSR